MLGERELPPQGPHRMAQHGITRTFQSIRLFVDLSVIDNVMVGFHLQLKSGLWAHLLQTRAAVAEEALSHLDALCHMGFKGKVYNGLRFKDALLICLRVSYDYNFWFHISRQ
jgi:ABC-type branched-subunit amino acid transport system ATPase component